MPVFGKRHGDHQDVSVLHLRDRTKHPDACKNVGADTQVVISDDKMESLDSRIGQAASIMAVTGKGAISSPGGEDRHQRHHQGLGPQQPGL
jgi:hypothetical protein